MRPGVLLWAALVGCTSSEGEWADEKQTLNLWQEGASLLSEGKPEESAEAISAALEVEPKNATLWLWKAKALADQGDHAGAVEAASRALLHRRDFVEALYNRGCWRSRLGNLEDAALDIQRVVELGGIDRHTMARDPDLDALRTDSRFASSVPARELLASAEADSQAFFVGSWWSLVLTATLPVEEDALEIHWLGEGAVPLELERVVENRVLSGVLVERHLEYVFRVVGAGTGEVGPWKLVGGGLDATLDPVAFRFFGPPGGDGGRRVSLEGVFLTPEQRLMGLTETGAIRNGARVGVRGLPGDKLELPPQAGRPVEIEVRREGQPQWVAWEFLGDPGSRTAIRREGALVYEGTP
ncbi:MAG: tetratricopeptide repeat protein [Myxococcota bacterium]|nr:tetratricopeptide repeat protein [Myxococcota bacterium]